MTKFRIHLLAALSMLFLLQACARDPIGAPCRRSGDGFSARHNCKTACLSIWTITCPDGSVGNSKVCAGQEGCERGSCSTGEVCYQTNIDRAYCVPESICADWKDPKNHPPINLQSFE